LISIFLQDILAPGFYNASTDMDRCGHPKESHLNKIVNEKLDQAVELLKEQGLDIWLTFVRETTLTPDPCLDIVAGLGVTWHSAFLISKTGERVAIVGRFDAENIHNIGGYTDVIAYDQSIRP